jgi:hypothetical protein
MPLNKFAKFVKEHMKPGMTLKDVAKKYKTQTGGLWGKKKKISPVPVQRHQQPFQRHQQPVQQPFHLQLQLQQTPDFRYQESAILLQLDNTYKKWRQNPETEQLKTMLLKDVSKSIDVILTDAQQPLDSKYIHRFNNDSMVQNKFDSLEYWLKEANDYITYPGNVQYQEKEYDSGDIALTRPWHHPLFKKYNNAANEEQLKNLLSEIILQAQSMIAGNANKRYARQRQEQQKATLSRPPARKFKFFSRGSHA